MLKKELKKKFKIAKRAYDLMQAAQKEEEEIEAKRKKKKKKDKDQIQPIQHEAEVPPKEDP